MNEFWIILILMLILKKLNLVSSSELFLFRASFRSKSKYSNQLILTSIRYELAERKGTYLSMH